MWPLTPWRPLEPPTPVFRLMQVVAVPPIVCVGLPTILVYNSLSYFYYRPRHGFIRHLVTNTLRKLQTLLTLGCVTRRDPDEWKVPKLALFWSHLAEIGEVRTVPPMSADIPLLPHVKVITGRGIVKPEPRPAFMIAPKGTPQNQIWGKAQPGEKAIFYIIGGGYQMGQPVQWFVTWELATRLGLRIFHTNYRKCLSDDSAWPAPLLDYLAAWEYMVNELGFEPQNIMLWGASAGGHGCLSLTRYLEALDYRDFKRLGLPGAVFASAPWCDVTGSFPSLQRNAHKDWLGSSSVVIQPSFTRHYSLHAQRDPLMSPAFAPRGDRHFARLAEKGVKMHVDYGEDEKLHDEVEATVGVMRAQGLDVDVLEVPGGTHCEYVFARMPIKLWPGIGFSWPMIADATERLVRAAWPKHVIPGQGVVQQLQLEKDIKDGKVKAQVYDQEKLKL